MESSSNSIPQVFTYQNIPMRIKILDNMEWFCVKDICSTLGIKNYRDSIRYANLEPEDSRVEITDTPGGPQEMLYVNEPGLYLIIITSRKPEAKVFKKWLATTGLPQIRQIGLEVTKPNNENLPTDHIKSVEMYLIELKKNEKLRLENNQQKKVIIEQTPKVLFHDTVTKSTTTTYMDVVAKTLKLGFGRNILFKLLRRKRVLLSSKYKKNTPYQKYVNMGYFEIVESLRKDNSGELDFTPVVTQKGMDFILKLVNKEKDRIALEQDIPRNLVIVK